MNIVPAAARKLFTEAPPASDAVRQRLAASEQSLTDARVTLSDARASHAERALELMSRSDGGKGLAASRLAIEQAEANVDDLAAVVATLRHQLAQLEQDERGRTTAQAWDQAASLLARRTAAASDLQDKADALLAALRSFLVLNDQAYAALPASPSARPAASTWRGACTLVELYLYGHSEGVICQQGTSPHVAKSRPDLAAAARDLAAQLLNADPRRQGGAS